MTIKDKNWNNKPINYEGISPDANLSVSPFGQNRVAEIAYRKAERLVLATHLVTNFVPESESVRENIREHARTLLPWVMDLRTGVRGANSGQIDAIASQVRLILSLLDVLHVSGQISNMNLEVLKCAYADFARFLTKSENGVSAENLVLEERYFVSPPVTDKGHASNKGHIEVVKDKIITDTKKDSNFLKDIKAPKDKRPQSLRAKRRATSRRMAILDVVTKRSPVHIKDIATEVTECSEKTIQRELASLIRDGVVKKEGSKRWTLYSLVI
ncbi:hypothetical protein CL652_01530 [bacterium]|nr:hypothetical protein [bacterium]|tara:strand:- start:8775 stop:9587 length:813 start_codon:yes stop_codon:yes gene_type:complete